MQEEITIRKDGRQPDDTRELVVERDFLLYPPGSVLVAMGNTKVICTATVEERVPPWLRGAGQGWVTAEYNMLPGSTQTRQTRESSRGRVGGRTHEIQRLIGRSLRSVVDLGKIGERTIWIDCDVIQADGGTRTTAITGAYIAFVDALHKLAQQHQWERLPVSQWLAAISVGIVDGVCMVDLCYEEDVAAQVDMNLVMTGDEKIVEVQGTAEGAPFSMHQMDELFSLARRSIAQLIEQQRSILGSVADKIGVAAE